MNINNTIIPTPHLRFFVVTKEATKKTTIIIPVSKKTKKDNLSNKNEDSDDESKKEMINKDNIPNIPNIIHFFHFGIMQSPHCLVPPCLECHVHIKQWNRQPTRTHINKCFTNRISITGY